MPQLESWVKKTDSSKKILENCNCKEYDQLKEIIQGIRKSKILTKKILINYF